MDENADTIDHFMALDDDQLFSELADHIPSLVDTFYSPEGKRRAARQWFEAIVPELRRKLCTEWSLVRKMNDPQFQDLSTLLAAMADVVATLSLGVPATLIAVVIFRIGIRNFCGPVSPTQTCDGTDSNVA